MSVDLRGSHSLPCKDEAANSGDSSPMPEVHGPEENGCSQVAAEMLQKEIASPCPSSVDLPRQDSPDSSTRPKLKLTGPESEEDAEKEDNKVHTKKQKMRTVFSQAQLCALRERFQRQRYLNLQQMQELSAILNLSYKQVKTWFQNQRMKCKRWQKSQWQKSNGVTQKGSAFVEYPSLHSSYPQGCLNTSGSPSVWDNQTLTDTWSYQTWTNPTSSNQTWTNSACSNQALTSLAWSNQALTDPDWSTQVCVWVCALRRPEALDAPGNEVPGVCEPPDMAVVNQTPVLEDLILNSRARRVVFIPKEQELTQERPAPTPKHT
nr:homeobox protein NANOG isoform X1 [Peromyscus maniculatus bairdii]XP_042129996.1 homeobox protein NANOG isoform X1 [Peromyscus maniculatus bairdii]XP_042129997.1 homeobox protein NANOG isoform X1 [Peromyscus maniculatus bairdii]XP_042129998.1 homeobox protein NANOG isoform X1 [Peromyscus maniculatus bairdii]XP_042129999.1 homeobox protein NANOG isoform X1 [Peromyscus maniculatus bairdii]XP_042130000.1 homeobox protein NANOG isoform X1 [Peromyscus maniculatus bairdii]